METPVNQRISMKEQLKTDEGDLGNPFDHKNLNGPKILLTVCSRLQISQFLIYLAGKYPLH